MGKRYWNPSLYDESYGFVSRYGLDLIHLLNPKKEERILDAGCATGDITQKIADFGAYVVGIDSSADMIAKAKEKYPQLNFHRIDITCLASHNRFHDKYDGIISNAVLHWVKDAEAALVSIYSSLKSGGRFVAEMGGKGNIEAIISTIERSLDHFGYSENKSQYPWVFFTAGEYASLMEKVGFIIRDVYYFDRPTELGGEDGLRQWLTMFGDIFFNNISKEKLMEIYSFIETELRDELFLNGKWWADYKRLRVKVEKH